MEEFQRHIELDRSWQYHFIYPLIFQEYIYTFAYDHGFNKSILLENTSDKKYSLLILKRLITRMYQKNHLTLYVIDSNQNEIFGYKHKKNLYLQMIREGFAVIVEIPFFLLLISSLEGKNSKISKFAINSFNISFFRGQTLPSKLCVRYINTLPRPTENLGSNSLLLVERCLLFAFITILSL